MRREDAPVAGWYPDPKDRMVLRWWDGLDWTEARRAPPSQAELLAHRTAQQAALAAAPPSAFTQQVAHHAQTDARSARCHAHAILHAVPRVHDDTRPGSQS